MTDPLVVILKEDVKGKLQQRASQNGRSMEEEVRQIRAAVLETTERKGLGSRIASQFSEKGFEGEIEELRTPPRPARLE